MSERFQWPRGIWQHGGARSRRDGWYFIAFRRLYRIRGRRVYEWTA